MSSSLGFGSIAPATDGPLDILAQFDLEQVEAIELYKAKLEKDANKYISEFSSGIKVVNGPYGPYITDGKKNAKIPKDIEPKNLTEEECKKLLDEAPARKKFTKRRTAKK